MNTVMMGVWIDSYTQGRIYGRLDREWMKNWVDEVMSTWSQKWTVGRRYVQIDS